MSDRRKEKRKEKRKKRNNESDHRKGERGGSSQHREDLDDQIYIADTLATLSDLAIGDEGIFKFHTHFLNILL